MPGKENTIRFSSQQLQPRQAKKDVLNLITKPLLTSTMLALKEGTFVEVKEGLSVDQEGQLLSWMVELCMLGLSGQQSCLEVLRCSPNVSWRGVYSDNH